MSTAIRTLILAGGLGPERAVSLQSGHRVAAALASLPDLDVSVGDLDADLLTCAVDVVFPVLHGGAGEDGSSRELLDLLGVPYVGAAAGACRLAYDKPAAKQLLARAGMRTPRACTLPQDLFADLGADELMARVTERIGIPLIVKPAHGGSALGCTVVREAAGLPGALATCFAYDRTALIEQLIDGTEVAVAVVDAGSGPEALPAIEIAPLSGTYDYTARYTAGATEFFVPARMSAVADAAVTELALTAHAALGLRDLSRTDAIVDASGVPWFLEVNVAPGLTETSLLPLAARASGRDLAELYGGLVRAAAARRHLSAGMSPGVSIPGR